MQSLDLVKNKKSAFKYFELSRIGNNTGKINKWLIFHWKLNFESSSFLEWKVELIIMYRYGHVYSAIRQETVTWFEIRNQMYVVQ